MSGPVAVRMPGLRPLRRPRLWLGLWVAMITAVAVVSLIPPPPLPVAGFSQIDKVEHVAGYFVLAAMACALFAGVRARALAGAGLVLLGVGLEVAQGQWTATRQPDAWDALANTVGVFLGLAATPAARLLAWLDARMG